MKYRLCILTTDSTWGGTEKMIHTLLEALDSSMFEVHLITLKGDETLIRRCENLCVKTQNYAVKSKLDFRVFIRLLRYLKENKIEILHTFLFHANILGRLAGHIAKTPVVISSQRNTDNWRSLYHMLLDRWTSRWADVIISNSHAGKNRLEKHEKIASEKIIVIPNGLEESAIDEPFDQKQLREGYGLLDGKVIGMLSNFMMHKVHRIFVDSARILLKENRDLNFIIAGDGKNRVEFENEIKKTDFARRIVFLGKVSDINAFLAMLDVFVLPSEWEGMPVALMEAMLAGKPVIATKVGDVPNLVSDQKEGLLIPPCDVSELVKAIAWLIQHPVEGKQMGQRAKKKIIQDFSRRTMIERIKNVYLDQMIKSNGRR